jgi:hypothetical protein
LNPPAEASTLIEMISASWMSQAICTAAELGIADQLIHGAKDIDDLAQSTRAHPGSLRRLMRALASLGLCAEGDDDSFELTTTGALLRTDAPQSLHAWAIWWGRYRWPLPGELGECVMTGLGARQRRGQLGGRTYRDSDTKAASVFNQSMVELTRLAATEVLRVRDFSAVNRVADIGGGFGEMLAVLLTAHPGMQGTLFDLPPAIAGAVEHLARAGVAERCELVVGSFFDAVPQGADVYLLKSVLHSWDDKHCRRILRNCRIAMEEDARLILVERIMPARMQGLVGERSAARSDLHMLLASGGLERTQAEFAALLADTGFETMEFTPAGLDHWVIEAGRRSRD